MRPSFFAFFISLSACGGASATETTSDAGREGAAACSALANVAAAVSVDAGGRSGATGRSVRQRVRITTRSGALLAQSVVDDDTRSATLVSNGVTLTTTDTCPDQSAQQLGYTATPTSIAIFIPDGGHTLVERFTRL